MENYIEMKNYIDYEGRRIEYELVYRKRKSVSIIVESQGLVRVLAPQGIKRRVVLDLVKRNILWIEKQLQHLDASQEGLQSRRYVSGEEFLYRGIPYKCQVDIDDSLKKVRVQLAQGIIWISSPDPDPEVIKLAVEGWYRTQAQQLASERVNYYQEVIGRPVGSITIKNQQKRWGSCSQKGNLNFNWRLALVPDPIFDYLVVHEMCHLVHLNHSSAYWSLVASILPDYKERRAWLKDKSAFLFAHTSMVSRP